MNLSLPKLLLVKLCFITARETLTKTETGAREWTIVVTALAMFFWGGVWGGTEGR